MEQKLEGVYSEIDTLADRLKGVELHMGRRVAQNKKEIMANEIAAVAPMLKGKEPKEIAAMLAAQPAVMEMLIAKLMKLI